jgi:hypothetical protein
VAKSADPNLKGEAYSALFFFDNPSFGRALRYTFAEKRLGRAVFMNALALVVALGVVQDLFTRGGFGLISEKLSFGRAAFMTIAVVETLVVSILGPLSFTHIFNAERREDCFDQVVASGCSPVRILLGRYAAVLVFLTVVVGSALPFFVLAAVVLRGASVGDVASFYGVLALYGSCIAAMTMATCVAVEDAAFPIVLSGLFALVVGFAGFSPHVPPAGGAWSPFRHIIVDLAPVARQIGYGEMLPPALYGYTLPTAPVSCVIYVLGTLLALAYTCVGPDLELSEGLDSFASVTMKRGSEASRGRRGLPATLLRTVQLRFFYENLGARLRALGPMLRLGSTASLFVISHVLTLGSLWPRSVPHAFSDLKEKTTNPYLAFTAISVGLIGLASSGSRAAVLARVPVLSIFGWKISRFPALFLLLGIAIALPPLLFLGTCRHHGVDTTTEDAHRVFALYGLIALYAVFMFSVGLVTAMVTTNPYSAMGSALGIIFFLNLLPLGWIPLFTSNVVTEDSSRILDVSPLFAAWSVMEPEDGLTLTTVRDEQTIQYEHKPIWQPFVYLHAPVALVLLAVGLVLERRDARTRKFLSALAVGGLLFLPGTAHAQAPPAWHVELDVGLGGKASQDGFTPLAATVENDSDHDENVTVVVREPVTLAPLARLGPVFVPHGRKQPVIVRGVAPAEPIAQAKDNLLVQAVADERVLVETQAKADTLPRDRLLVVLDKTGGLPFALPSGGLRSTENAPVRRTRGTTSPGGAAWTTAFIADQDSLPVTPQAWTGAGAVFLNELRLEAWSAPQARALAGWLGRGGDLVIAVGERAELLRKSHLGEALDAELEALPLVAPRLDVDVGEGARAAKVAVLEPTARDRVILRDGQGQPLALQRRCGAGRLTLLAFDPWQPPYLHEEATRGLFERILSLGPRYRPRTETLFPELSQLRVQPARIGPAFAVLLLYALLVGPGIYFSLRPKKKGLLAWVLVPAVTLLFSALMPLYKLVLARSESAMVTASLVETNADDPWESETADALVFSGGLEHHDMAVRGNDVTASILLPPRGFRAGPPRAGATLGVPFEDETSLHFGVDVPLWGARYVSAELLHREAKARLPGSRVLVTKNGVQLELGNDGPTALEDAIVLFPDFRAGIHCMYHELALPLKHGDRLDVVAEHKTPANWVSGGPAQKDLSQTLSRRLVSERLVRRVEDAHDPFEAYLVGHASEAPPAMTATPHVRLRAQAVLVVARIPVVFGDLVPYGACSIKHTAVAPVDSSGASVELVKIELPANAGGGKPPSVLKVELVPSAVPLDRFALAWKDARGEFQPLPLASAERDAQGRRAVFTLPVEALEEGAVTLRETVDSAPSAAGAPGELDLSAEW